MRIGVPTEIKAYENRVALEPDGAAALVGDGHEVFIQKDAGVGSGIADESFVAAGPPSSPTLMSSGRPLR